LIRRGHSQVDEAAHLLQFFFVDKLQRIEILDFCSDPAGKTGAIKMRNTGYAAFCGEQIAPDLFCSVPNRADQADASDYDATSQLLPAFRVLTDVVESILHSAEFLGIFIGNLHAEGFLQCHDELNLIK